MKSNFSKFILAPVALAAVALATSLATAETTVRVPFKFTAGGQVCPAGYYTVQHDDSSHFVTLTSKDTLKTFTWVVGPGAPQPTERKIALKFDQLGGTHVLQSIQYGSLVTSQLDKKTLHQMEQDSQLNGGR
jgi:hypothetical protein